MRTNTVRRSLQSTARLTGLALLCVLGQSAHSQRSAPGAPTPAGHFFEFNGSWLRERDPYTYSTPTYIWHSKLPTGYGWVSRPMRWEPTIYQPGGQFLFVGKDSSGWQMLMQWSPAISGSWRNYGSPPLVQVASAPSQVMYGNRVYVVGSDGQLWEKFLNSSAWYSFGYPLGNSLRATPPCVLRDGTMFMVTAGGKLIRMWWSSSTQQWYFTNHGYPYQSGFNTVKAVSVGAPMATGKVFVTCSDGTLRQLWYDTSSGLWIWYNHGRPDQQHYVDSVPEAIRDGKLFVTANLLQGSYFRSLYQLYWNGSNWQWYSHGSPSNQLKPGVAICPGVDRIFSQDNASNPWEVYYGQTSWQWQAH